MRCNTLFYAIILPSVTFAQSGFPTGSDMPFPTGVARGKISTHKSGTCRAHSLNESSINLNHTSGPSDSSRLHTQLPANQTGIYTASYTSKPAGETHQPFSKSSGLFFANVTSGSTKPTGTGLSVHASGTGVSSKSSRIGTYTRPSSGPKPVTSSTGRLPYTKSAGAMFTNTTSGGPVQTARGFHPSGTGASSGFARPTEVANFAIPSANVSKPISATERLPFSKSAGAFFITGTDGAAGPTGFAHSSGTAVSSGFAKPTGVTDFSHPSASSSKPVSATGRLPFSKSAGLVFLNSTSAATGPIGFAHPSGTRASPGCAKPTGSGDFTHHSSISKSAASTGRLPFMKSAGAMFTNTTSTSPASSTGFPTGAFPTAPKPTGSVSSGLTVTVLPLQTKSAFINATSSGAVHSTSVITPASGHSLYTKPTTPLFSNSTSSSIPTGVISTGVIPTTFSTLASSISMNVTSTIASAPSATPVAEYYQCGGINWTGGTTCVEGTVCKYWNPYYWQCVSEE